MQPILLKSLPASADIEIHLDNYIANSALKISCPKDIPMDFTLYVVCKCFILKFDLFFLNTGNEKHCYFYAGKEIRFCRKPDLLTEENTEEIYNSCDEFRTLNFLSFLNGVEYESGDYFYKE